MKVVVRADGGGAVGWGHLGRCAALAEVLHEGAVEVQWACRPSGAVERLVGRPPDLLLDGSPTMDRLPLDEASKLAAFADGADWIVVDHYGAESAYLDTLRQHSTARILLFEDHQHRQGADLRLAPMQSAAPNTLTGAAYQPVKSCFPNVPQDGDRGGWVLALGGADPRDDTARCLRALEDLGPLTVLASDDIAKRQGLDAWLSERQGQGTRIPWLAPSDLATTFAASAGALVSASTLVWEAMATRTPVVALQTADNQSGVVEALNAAQIPVYTDAEEASNALRAGLAALPPSDARLDGLGAWRVARAMGVQAQWPPDLDSESES